ncbi:hypothetical protein QBC45DRAFT_420874 [Copromyces sp. CBS 386.78]|nr:hypothetical protein QBC45DRAFT_420874 [Copromyces sp. CBS 386.78]
MLSLQHSMPQTDLILDPKRFSVAGQVLVHHGTRHVLPRLDAERLGVHGVIEVFVGALEVVGAQAVVEPFLGPDAADGRGLVEDGEG